MAEEHGFQAPEGHRLCANNCGFFGSPATRNLCSKCYGDHCMKEEQANSAKSVVENSLFPAASSSAAPPPEAALAVAPSPAPEVRAPAAAETVTVAQPNRCLVCRKRVGLTGFKCRCGTTFCGTHRYPEQHGCSFDYRAAGREAIARENPLVKAEKLDKI
ncbi:zinc finger A20 and AN1 domain-containing stress-associated protein 4 [Diospyros lotus]|uniref:zinc finger A20 and AN1 domain-containing stress-associated protein 4 n=1 Tax=Diospyros lotus TaxID=55363 RepID=UPI002252F1B2|nr:zinc finger A20 and AN1 domain-containing stress-associated protein 4 [Diospyros lotus]